MKRRQIAFRHDVGRAVVRARDVRSWRASGMRLAPGTRIGRYEIRSLLGAGGMGEVYLAQDTTLRRMVALKLLPAALATNEDRLRRIEREAHAASSLNHPNILTIHEIATEGGTHFIATEFM